MYLAFNERISDNTSKDLEVLTEYAEEIFCFFCQVQGLNEMMEVSTGTVGKQCMHSIISL